MDAAKNIGVAIVIGFVVLALVTASAVKNVTTKIVMTLLLAGLALGVWTQRTRLQDCAQQVRNKSAVGDLSPTTCEFFGAEVRVPDVAPTPTTVP